MMAAVQDNYEESLTELGLEECVESGMRERIAFTPVQGEWENKVSRSVFPPLTGMGA